jgi:hypothetical protein
VLPFETEVHLASLAGTASVRLAMLLTCTDVHQTANVSSRNIACRLVQGKKVAIAGKKK